MPTAGPSASGRETAIGALVAAAGIALFVWLVWRVGPQEIWTGFRQIGWWLLVILMLGGLRFSARAAAWTLAVDPPHRLRFRDAFGAAVSGDAVGNVTPFGPIVGEPAKIACLRGRIPLGAALTSLAIENLFYTLSVAATIAAGTIALLFTVDLPSALREFSEIALAAIAAFFIAAGWAAWQRPAILSRWFLATPFGRMNRVRSAFDRLRALEDEIYTFAARRQAVVAPMALLEIAFHILGVVEAYVTLHLILGVSPGVLAAFLLESSNRLITVAFKFVPFQVGFGEAGSAYLTQLLGLGSGPGLTLSIVRKARMGVWSLIGTALLVRQGLSMRRILEEAESPVRITPTRPT